MIRAFLSLALVDGLRLSRQRVNLFMLFTIPVLIVAGSAALTRLFVPPDEDVTPPAQTEQAKTHHAAPHRIAVPDVLREPIDASKRFVVTASTAEGFSSPPENTDFALSREDDVLTLSARDPTLDIEDLRKIEGLLERAIQKPYRSAWRFRGPTRHKRLVGWNISRPKTTDTGPSTPNWILAFALAVILMSQSLASTLFTQTRVERTRDTLSMTPLLEYFTLLSKFFWVLAPSLTAGFLTGALYMYPPLGLAPVGEEMPPMYGAIPLGVTICFCMMAIHARAVNLRASSALSIIVTLPLLFLILPGVVQAELPSPIWMFPITSATHLAHSVHLGSQPIKHLHPLLISWFWIAMLVLSTRLAWRYQPKASNENAWEIFTKACIAVLLASWLIGQPLLLLSPIGGLAFNEVALLALFACAIPWWAGQPWRETIGFRRPDKRTLVIALLVGLTSPALTLWVHEIQQLFSLTPTSGSIEETWSNLSPFSAILMLAVLPGICEELMFRGSLLGLLRYQRIGETPAILATAFVFGALHFDPARIFPTLILGICLGVLAFRSRCVWVAVLTHILHNTLLLLGISEWFIQTGLTAPIACTAIGLTWLTRSTR